MHVFATASRLLRHLLPVAALVAAGGCGGIAPTGFSGDVDALLARGAARIDRLAATPGERLTDSEVLALGYAERVRLGLGSPFRTIDYALRDTALSHAEREILAYGLLARVVEGQAYEVEARVLDLSRLAGVPDGVGTGEAQLELIERTIRTAPSAAAGERIVRLAYMIAGAERTVAAGQLTIQAQVAALVADRRRASEDASRLLRTAALRSTDPLTLLQDWRRGLRFRVEQPSQVALSVGEEEAEARGGPEVARALRTLAQRQSAPGSFVRQGRRRDGTMLLDSVAAARLRDLAERRDYPAQAPIAVAVAINREGLVDRPGLREWQKEARGWFIDFAFNEERLIAGAATLDALDAWSGVRPSLILLQSAGFMRGWNQEEPWFPGDVAPTARDLEARFGLAAVAFDESIPERWRPYYLRTLGRGFADLRRVLPTMALRGLRIHIGEVPDGVHALALHEPRTRTLYLPPRTGAGTLAHEVAHDLDWQLARRRYAARGGYATDLAVRDRRGDRIAAAMMELSTSLAAPRQGAPSRHDTRPAEVFARGADWMVSTILARQGRAGGYLTSFQDPVLTGYGTTRGPDISGAAVPALLSLLDAAAAMPAESRDWIVARHGPRRSLNAMELTRAVVEAGAGLSGDARLAAIEKVAEQSLQAVSECRYASADGLRRLAVAQRELAEASIAAAARGAAMDAAQDLGYQLAGDIRPLVDQWLAWRLDGAPEPVDPLLEEIAPAFEDILLRAKLISEPGVPGGGSPFRGELLSPLCNGNPFAAPPTSGPLQQ